MFRDLDVKYPEHWDFRSRGLVQVSHLAAAGGGGASHSKQLEAKAKWLASPEESSAHIGS